MKKYVLLSGVFIVIFFSLQLIIGFAFTALHTPDTESAWMMSTNLPQQVAITGENNPIMLLLILFLSAFITYVLAKIWMRLAIGKKDTEK